MPLSVCSSLLARRTSSKQSRLKEYLAVESLPDLSIEEIEKMEKSCEGAYYQSLVSIYTVLRLLYGAFVFRRFLSPLSFVFSGTFQYVLGFHCLSHDASTDAMDAWIQLCVLSKAPHYDLGHDDDDFFLFR